jgi:hypothetical protein
MHLAFSILLHIHVHHGQVAAAVPTTLHGPALQLEPHPSVTPQATLAPTCAVGRTMPGMKAWPATWLSIQAFQRHRATLNSTPETKSYLELPRATCLSEALVFQSPDYLEQLHP